ncbi:hypothetical protein QRD43_04960 [Pelomonas sp. APW6]|uniref:DUF1328 domain-containing protein n=1 Tax=Roseateles subflavus TaxID=3053353 RepID=A0ABT7LEG8_9BURK|nr:hypothetical protein [Pelomonas sp. APW6]MDL5031251.1 hypothetical protein [Pelomonas sp. APW6]
MLHYALLFCLVALVAGGIGLLALPGEAGSLARQLAAGTALLALVALGMGLRTGR